MRRPGEWVGGVGCRGRRDGEERHRSRGGDSELGTERMTGRMDDRTNGPQQESPVCVGACNGYCAWGRGTYTTTGIPMILLSYPSCTFL